MNRPPPDPRPARVRIDGRWWALGVVDACSGQPPRAGVADGLSYQSGRVEGEAARLAGRSADEVLIAHRSTFRAAHFRATPNLTGKPEPGQ